MNYLGNFYFFSGKIRKINIILRISWKTIVHVVCVFIFVPIFFSVENVFKNLLEKKRFY